ncbi:MAG: polysaccharide deacetylase family protein [Desulfuromonadales bacterium]|nr:polysaccharide deacetylase family protein [Desulfuromonadales bacterium]
MTELAGNIRGSTRQLVCSPVKRLINRIDPPVIVLLYHRVTTLPSDPELLAVSPANFREQMQYLKDTFPIVRFEEDWSGIANPAVCVTFDDGYADNALEALPILEEVGVPATFFVSTGRIGSRSEFWWHELERIILETESLPPSFTLADDRFGRSWPTGLPGERRAFYQGIVRLMNDVDAGQRTDWLAQLRRWAQTGEGVTDRHRAMTVDELHLLAASSRVTIGAHTVTHTRLSSLSQAVQREEISASKRELEGWLGREISTFSYPFGRRSDYTQESIALCRQAGFSKSAANFPGQAHRWTDPYQIPRNLVRNWPLEIFTGKLRGFWTR